MSMRARRHLSTLLTIVALVVGGALLVGNLSPGHARPAQASLDCGSGTWIEQSFAYAPSGANDASAHPTARAAALHGARTYFSSYDEVLDAEPYDVVLYRNKPVGLLAVGKTAAGYSLDGIEACTEHYAPR